MTSTAFSESVLRFSCYPAAFLKTLSAIAKKLSPSLRDKIIDDLVQGEDRQVQIIERAIAELTKAERHLKSLTRHANEDAEREEEAKNLPLFS